MEEAATCRRAAREAVRDIEPERLRTDIDDLLADASMAPGALALLSARAADVLVARGFYLLARTDAAETAVETVRAFGRDQTRRREPGADTVALDGSLERNVLELAITAGATAVGVVPSAAALETASTLFERREPPLPPAEDALPDSPGDLGIGATATERGGSDGVPQSASDR